MALDVQEYVERHAVDGGRTILLRAAPVVSVASVTYTTEAGVETVVPTGYWLKDPDAGILEFHGSCRGPGLATVTYTAGYEAVPGDVEDAVLEHAATIAMVMAHLQQESGGSTQQTYGKEATVGTTSKWVSAVKKYNLQERA